MEQNKQLNPREKAVLDYIRLVIARQGYPPSVRDICAALGYKSTSTVQMYLDRLLSYGVLCRESGKSRSLRLVEDAFAPALQVYFVKIAKESGNGILTKGCFSGAVMIALPRTDKELFAFYAATSACGVEPGDLCIAESGGELDMEKPCVFSDGRDGFLIASSTSVSGKEILGLLVAVLPANEAAKLDEKKI